MEINGGDYGQPLLAPFFRNWLCSSQAGCNRSATPDSSLHHFMSIYFQRPIFLRKEQRRTPRFTFIASAELIEQKTDVRIATRVSELGLHGCYLDMMNPFPKDTLVLVKIFAGEEFFHAKAKIVYVQPNLGAGVS